ncbi:MAG TPA: hypothetical protein VFX96_18770 [Pyrinomonadaceae bacterium]|nr:hypothetical protein [Pyrinomonadaceae bacterium]
MEEKVFWELLGAACRMGRFVAAVPNAAASANIVGKLEVGEDGGEAVLQRRKRPSAHVHFRPEAIAEFAFTFVDPGFGAQPCLELRTREGAAVLRLYYQGKRAARRFEEFAERTRAHGEFVKGNWLAPAAGENEGIFVGGDGEKTDGVDAEVVERGDAEVVDGGAAEVFDKGDAGVDEGGAGRVDESDAGERTASSRGGESGDGGQSAASQGAGEAAEVVNAS